MSVSARASSGAVTVVLLLAVAALSQLPVSAGSDEAVIRLSWRSPAMRIEECRTLTPEELEGVAEHMRRSEECSGYSADFELRVSLDSRPVRVDTVAPAGARRDRPVYVFVDVPVEPGRHDVEITFSALVPDDAELGDAPRTLEWRGTMELGPRRVGLVTLAEDGRSLERRQRGRAP